jgi:hypothetical protein
MPRFFKVLLSAIVGFVVAALGGCAAIELLSSNQHDLSLEATMTAVFFFGPVGALVAGAWAYFRR